MSGQVIAFPSTTPSLAGGRDRTHSEGGSSSNKNLAADEFLTVLRTNVAQAEGVVAGAKEEQSNDESEPDAQAREEMLETSFFGSFLGSVEERMAAFMLRQPTTARAAADLGHASAANRVGGVTAGTSRLSAAGQVAQLRLSGHTRVPGGQATSMISDSHGVARRSFSGGDMNLSRQEPAMMNPDIKVSELSWDEGSEAREGVTRSEHDSKLPVLEAVASNRSPELRHGLVHQVNSRHRERQGEWERPVSEPVVHDATVPLSEVAELHSLDRRPEPTSAATQIAENIRTAASPAVDPRISLPGEIHKSIKFKLHPEHLGDVEVRLQITGEKIAVSIKLERAEVATEIEQAKDDLCDMLDGCGIVVDFIEVGVSRSQREPLPANQSSMPTADALPNRLDDQRDSAAGNNGDSHQGAPGSDRYERNDGKENLLVASDVSPRHLNRSGIFL